MAELDLNFQIVANAQSLDARTREVSTIGVDFARVIVEEVALAASKDNFQRARSRFITSVRTAIMAEISQMAMLIAQRLPLPDKYTGPNGQMSLGGRSVTAKKLDFQETFKRQSTNIRWASRSKKYLAWKAMHNLPARWWEASGDLRRDLASKGAEFYEDAFGPVRVRLSAPGRDTRGRFAKKPKGPPTPALNPEFGPKGVAKSGRRNITTPNSRGAVSAEVSVGTLEVDVFGKITPAMLPGLARATWNPKLADPTPGLGLVSLFPDDGEEFGTKEKLLYLNRGGRRGGNGQAHHRYAIEPFVSFYLMRAIPNAVWKRTEKLIRGDVSVGGLEGVEDFSAPI